VRIDLRADVLGLLALQEVRMPQANSTTSMPRCTEPIASGEVLPCSSVTIPARSF
jgi:hypothetical protein